MISYEWSIETVDTVPSESFERGTVTDSEFFDICPGLPGCDDKRLVLVRSEYDGRSLVERSWARVSKISNCIDRYFRDDRGARCHSVPEVYIDQLVETLLAPRATDGESVSAVYEWRLETLSPHPAKGFDPIVTDVEFFNTCPANLSDDKRLALVRSVWTKSGAEERTFAYVVGGKLDLALLSADQQVSHDVPQKYIDEFDATVSPLAYIAGEPEEIAAFVDCNGVIHRSRDVAIAANFDTDLARAIVAVLNDYDFGNVPVRPVIDAVKAFVENNPEMVRVILGDRDATGGLVKDVRHAV